MDTMQIVGQWTCAELSAEEAEDVQFKQVQSISPGCAVFVRLSLQS
jgi:hypothetical protein